MKGKSFKLILFIAAFISLFLFLLSLCPTSVKSAVPTKWKIVDVTVNEDVRGNPLGGYELRVQYSNGEINYSDRIVLTAVDVDLLKKYYRVKNNKQLCRKSFFATSTSTWKNDLMILIGRQPVG